MATSKLFEPYQLGPITLSNRTVMAPLTRNRAVAGLVPNPLAVDYYGQRASAGLLITEASQVSQQGQGYQDTPGIYSKEQIAGWRKVTDRVHEHGGRIFIQLWHVGRISHTSLQPNSGAPVAPSAVRAKGKTFVGGTFADVSEPRALELSEIPGIIETFKRGATNALQAGFDGVEIHGANGYLLDQFAKDGTNKRTDAYGGSIENRARLMLEVARAVVAEAGADRTGIRISPVTPANDVSDSNPQLLFDHIVDRLNAEKLVYIHDRVEHPTHNDDDQVVDERQRGSLAEVELTERDLHQFDRNECCRVARPAAGNDKRLGVDHADKARSVRAPLRPAADEW